MTQRRRTKYRPITDYSDPRITTKRWLRRVIYDAMSFWASIMKLDSFIDQLHFRIAEDDDPKMGSDNGAEVFVESTIRKATVRIKRGVVHKFAGEYHGKYSAQDVVEMTVIHELCHILVHQMAQWTSSTIQSMASKSALEKHFTEIEEVTVEHMTRVFFSLKRGIKDIPKFKGKIVYITKDSFED